jgi:hypothetical protein
VYERQQDRLTRLQDQLHAFHVQHPENITTTGRRGRRFSVMLMLPGMAFLLLGFILGQQAMLVGILAALAFIMLGGYVITVAPRSGAGTAVADLARSLHEQIDRAADAEQQALQALQASAASLQLDRLEADAFDEADTKLEHAQRTLDAWDALNETLAQASRAVARQDLRIDQAVDAVQRAASVLTQLTEQWCEWLRGHGLPVTYTPDTMAHFCAQADTARVELQRVKDCRRRIATTLEEIQQYRDLLQPLAETYAVAIASDDLASLATAAGTLAPDRG